MADENKQNEMPDELPAAFKDCRGRTWSPRLTLALVDEFCREQGITYGNFHAATLSQWHLIELLYRAVGFNTLAAADPMERKEFIARLADDEGMPTPAYEAAMAAVRAAIINFTLRSRLTKLQRRLAVAALMNGADISPDEAVTRAQNEAVDGLANQ